VLCLIQPLPEQLQLLGGQGQLLFNPSLAQGLLVTLPL
jgi:hypothetical protein